MAFEYYRLPKWNVQNRMECIADEKSTIQEFYKGTNVLITGGTGFMGKVLTEKLLRCCPDISTIYLLVRSKKGKDVDTRLEEIFNDPLFGPLKEKFPKFRHKVTAVIGDCSAPGLGLKPSDRCLLANEVNIVFHGAATVRFDEKMKLAIDINVMGTQNILSLAHEMTNVKAVMHISTVYCNCHLKEIEEKFYNYHLPQKKLRTVVECLSDKVLEEMTPILLGEWPNTYAFTKAMAEDLVREEGVGLPVGIFRPAIVVSTRDEPIYGWIDNVYGPTGVFVGAATGFIKTLNCDADTVANIVPVDMTINALIASAWEVGTRSRPEIGDDIPIYNYVSSVQKPITWGDFMEKGYQHGVQVPTTRAVWYYCLKLNKNRLMHLLYVLFLHFLPAFLIDGCCILLGKKPKLVKIYKKINKFGDVLSYFCTREWKFTNDNVQMLWKKLDKGDKQLFDFNMDNLNWDTYFYGYVRGVRSYLLKDDFSTVPQAKLKLKRLYWIHNITKYIILFLATRSLWSLGSMVYRNFELA